MALFTLDEAKAQLDIDTSASDVELQVYIDGITDVIEQHTGPIENRTVTEVVDSRDTRLALTQVPAVSLTSFSPVLSVGQAVAVEDLHLDGEEGIVRRRDGGTFAGGPWTAVYVAGRGQVPATIKLAALILLQHLWRTQYGAARGTSGADDFDVNEPIAGWGYAIPNRVMHLLEPFKVPPGMA